MNFSREIPTVSYRAHLLSQIRIGRRTLLGVILFTLLNLLFLLTSGDTYLLFSVSVPYYLTLLGKVMDNGGMYLVTNGTYTFTGLLMGGVLLLPYILIWLFSRKNGAHLGLSCILLGIDLVALVAVSWLLFENPLINIVDMLIHAVVIWQICKGAKAGIALKDAPPEIRIVELSDDDLPTNTQM